MYVLKGKPKICTPHSSKTNEPRNTKIGTVNLGPTLTPSAKIDLGRLMGGGATKPEFYTDLQGFPHFFSPSNPTSTRNYGPIFVFDTSNDVFPCIFVHQHNQNFPTKI
jgi:hypothetical protein